MKKSSTAGDQVPRHVAIIMDGNGRWAKERGLPRLRGHEAGTESVREAIRACRAIGIQYLTLYAFSTENWVRPRSEIAGLMSLLRNFLRDREFELHENRVRLRVIGRMEDLPGALQKELRRVIAATAGYEEGHLILALSYGGRDEIASAARAIARRVKRGELDPEDVNEKTVAAHLYLPDVPDPDLLIRTSGEMRVSNFLLWQISYSEIYVTKVLWPEFREAQLREAVDEFVRRRRRFGGLK
jgi:undecaprenyl diphosphate synthase